MHLFFLKCQIYAFSTKAERAKHDQRTTRAVALHTSTISTMSAHIQMHALDKQLIHVWHWYLTECTHALLHILKHVRTVTRAS